MAQPPQSSALRQLRISSRTSRSRSSPRCFLPAPTISPESLESSLVSPRLHTRKQGSARRISGSLNCTTHQPPRSSGPTPAFSYAGVGPEDLGVVELHDASAPAELM